MVSNPESRANASADEEKGKIVISVEKDIDFEASSRPQRWRILFKKMCNQMTISAVGRKRAWLVRIAVAVIILGIFAAMASLIWMFLVLALIHRLAPSMPRNGLISVLADWKEPTTSFDSQISWLPNFSSGVTPKPIHSHNDYTRDIPLFRALSVGCTGVEADIHFVDNELLVGHTPRDLRPARTLSSLYLNPLISIFESQNQGSAKVNGTTGSPWIGVFNDKPEEPLVLLLDFKTSPEDTLPLVIQQLQPLRNAGYLTQWNGTHLRESVLTIVASGLMSSRLDLQSTTNGSIFLDAPLLNLTSAYKTSNSLYASAPLRPALGNRIHGRGMNAGQLAHVENLVGQAQAKGLKARFWDTPSWPIGTRDTVWRQLVDAGVDMLNADDVQAAALWNWHWCQIAGIRLC